MPSPPLAIIEDFSICRKLDRARQEGVTPATDKASKWAPLANSKGATWGLKEASTWTAVDFESH